MGYTHYWRIPGCDTTEWQRAWPQLVEDTQRIIDAGGVELCGDYPSENYRDGDLAPPLVDVEQGIATNGIENGGHELFWMVRDRPGFQFCKTARKCYDAVVCCVLLRAHMLAPQCIQVSSDGYWNREGEWKSAMELYARLWPEDIILRPTEIEEPDFR